MPKNGVEFANEREYRALLRLALKTTSRTTERVMLTEAVLFLREAIKQTKRANASAILQELSRPALPPNSSIVRPVIR